MRQVSADAVDMTLDTAKTAARTMDVLILLMNSLPFFAMKSCAAPPLFRCLAETHQPCFRALPLFQALLRRACRKRGIHHVAGTGDLRQLLSAAQALQDRQFACLHADRALGEGGEILASLETVSAARGDFSVSESREVSLKGVAGSVQVARIEWRS
jgi:hypothetical protein